jgi:ATP-binding cassette subfamily G (WHITE) protein 2 (SNQ2)
MADRLTPILLEELHMVGIFLVIVMVLALTLCTAEQMDVHEQNTTVREALRFSAYLRQPFHVPKEEKDAYVEDVLELLELQDLSEAIVWSLGVEAKKRLTIGVELASKPELLLFLDEPTSGLDAQSAFNLVRFLRKLADSGQAILCTIHQPSSLLFESFDRLLLLGKGGNTVYFGDIGDDSDVMREYFARYGAPCPPNVNPAEYMLEAIGAGITPRIGDRDWKDIWLESPEFARAKEEIEEIKREALSRNGSSNTKRSMYATPFFYQLKIVVQRNALSLWRSPPYVFTRLISHIVVSLSVSLPFLRLGHSTRDLQYRVFGIFWVTVFPGLIMPQLEPVFITNRLVFIREASSRIYSPYVFAIGQLLGEMPYSIICAIIYWALMVSFVTNFGVHRVMRFLGIPDALGAGIFWLERQWVPIGAYLAHGAVRCNSRSTGRVNLAKYPDCCSLHIPNHDRS